MSSTTQHVRSPWPHRLAVVLACATFPLVWIGGLVTTTNSGMAVPDWPTTYGYNMFLYPWQSWARGPWGVFYEHGHRLWASSVGMLTIALFVVILRAERRPWVKMLAFAVLGLVIFQGVLGGVRVRLDDRTFAMIHGFTGPLFFAVTVAMAVLTSQKWESNSPQAAIRSATNIRLLALVTAVLAYLQIVLGAVVRHVPVDAQPATFVLAVKSHLFLAAVLTIHAIALVTFVLLRARGVRPLGGLAITLIALLCCQVVLGAGTWVVKYSVPAWAQGWVESPTVATQEGGTMQTHIITAHVAIGSAILGTAVALALYSQRLLAGPTSPQHIVRGKLEAAV